MTQIDQTDDKKEIAKLRKTLEKAKLDLAEKDKQLHLANQKIEYLEEENARLKDKERSLEERSTTLRENDRLLDLANQEIEHLKEWSLKAAVIQHGLSILTALSLGIGINFATSPPTVSADLTLIFIGIGTESISFYITYSGAQKNHK